MRAAAAGDHPVPGRARWPQWAWRACALVPLSTREGYGMIEGPRRSPWPLALGSRHTGRAATLAAHRRHLGDAKVPGLPAWERQEPGHSRGWMRSAWRGRGVQADAWTR